VEVVTLATVDDNVEAVDAAVVEVATVDALEEVDVVDFNVEALEAALEVADDAIEPVQGALVLAFADMMPLCEIRIMKNLTVLVLEVAVNQAHFITNV
jgi:hypothetical protein